MKKEKKMIFQDWNQLMSVAPKEISDKVAKFKTLLERNDFHPEPNGYYHIRTVTERLMTTGDIDLVLAGLFHDIGKLDVVKPHPRCNFVMTPGHDRASLRYVDKHKDWIEKCGADPEIVREIVSQHMRIKILSEMRETKQDEIKNLKSYPKLLIFTKADDMLTEFGNEDKF